MSQSTENGVQKAVNSAAAVHINAYMAADSAECIKKLQAELKDKATKSEKN